ncbi:MAG: class I SAM-dependent methyltransferase [Robiginitomaculum sp.]|nr:class I SAM-dependent methyltransferase [Robiginitomaculum sp.]
MVKRVQSVLKGLPLPEDRTYGYEAIAEEYMAVRSETGRKVVQKWAAYLPSGSSVLDIGAGSGEPLTSALIEQGLLVSAIDASPTMVQAFRLRFPGVEIACEPAESSLFFNRIFDAILAAGFVFLLREEFQRELFPRIAKALKPGGQLLFSAPRQVCSWNDLMTGQPSWSLGDNEYNRILDNCGLRLTDEYTDEGGTHYYEAHKVSEIDHQT